MTGFKKIVVVCGVATAFLCSGGSGARAAQPSELAGIHAADDAWLKAYNGGEVENVTALYDEHAVIYPPGVAPVRGRAAIRDFFARDMAAFAKTGLALALDPHPDGGVSKDMGWSSGTWTLKDKDGHVIDTGWYFSVSRNVGGKWLYVRDGWNSNKPPGPAAPTN